MIEREADLDFNMLQEALEYDPATGLLTWKFRPASHFSSLSYWSRANNRFAGREAGTRDASNGYRYVGLVGKQWLAHRLAWWLHTGAVPSDQIDHLNGIRDDNRWENLRAVTNAENGRNQRLRKNNTSGVNGVRWVPERNKWQARIKVNGKLKHLGYFTDKTEAVFARKQADAEMGFAEGHGKMIEAVL